MICRNCSKLIEPCPVRTCGIGWRHVRSQSDYCDDPPRHGVNPPRFAEPDPAT